MIKLNTELNYRRMEFVSANQTDSSKFPTLTINYSTVSINEISSENYFSIIPNPSTNNFIIRLNSEMENASIVIYNAIGEKIYFEKLNDGEIQKEIYLKESKAGIYFVTVFDKEKQYNKKLIIK
jgi:hypothetical protein